MASGGASGLAGNGGVNGGSVGAAGSSDASGGNARGGANGGSATSQGGASSNASGGAPEGGVNSPGGANSANGGRANSQGGANTSAGSNANPQGGANGSGGGASTGGASSSLSIAPLEGIYSYPRTASNGPTQSFRVTNSGSSTATFGVELAETTPGAFRITAPTSITNLTLAAGANLQLSVQFVPNGAGVPAAPVADSGGVTVNAKLALQGTGVGAQTNLFGLVMTIAGEGSGAEPTLGQILTTLGYDVDVGAGLRAHLENSTSAAAQGSEVLLPRFVRASSAPVTLRPVARFSPSGPMPFGYYTVAAPNCASAASYAANCHVVGTMSTNTDANTSNGSRMLNPPLTGATAESSFDPGNEPFGIWSYSDQASQKVSTGGSAANGDYVYGDNALNSPANMHRVRVFALRDRAGNAVSNSYLLGFEEASNGDYQDYVFVLSNVKAP